MTRGWLIVSLWAITGTVCLATPPQLKPGVERWPVKTSFGSATSAKTVALSALLALKDVSGVRKNDSRYQADRIPDPQPPVGREGDLIAVTGWLHLVALENDGDYHMQMSDSPTDGNICLVVEVPDADAAFVKDASLRDQAEAVRTFVRTNLFHDPTREGQYPS